MGNSDSKSKRSGDGDGDEDDFSDGDDDLLDMELQSSWQPTNYGMSPSDRRGLTKFFRAAGGDKWRSRSNWLKPSPLGMWHGVGVGSRHGQRMVVELSLHHNKIRGNAWRGGGVQTSPATN
jgi:hypothetical protein